MIALGQTHFYKFLKDCDSRSLIQYRNALEGLLSRGMGANYELEQASSAQEEALERWSKGYFKADELRLRFPRILFVFHNTSDRNERWIADVFFTRVPHIKGIYSNRDAKHSLASSAQKELRMRLVESEVADVFLCKQDETLFGTVNSLYAYQKIQHLTPLRNLAEGSKYTPQGSDLKDLLQGLSAIFSEDKGNARPIELPPRGRPMRAFLEKCDSRVAAAVSPEKLEALLQPVGISAKQWLNAGRQSFLQRLWSSGR